jgi:putative transposase
MDFMRDSLFHGKPFRAFNVIDDFNREALNITAAKSITASVVIQELNNLISWRGRPEKIRVDNGPEFIAASLREWCETFSPKIELVYIEKGKPNQNGFIERFNKTFREDVLDFYLFSDLNQAREVIHDWMWMYNNIRPHSALNNLPPTPFLLKYGKLHLHDEEKEFPTFQQEHQRQQLRVLRKNSIFECS